MPVDRRVARRAARRVAAGKITVAKKEPRQTGRTIQAPPRQHLAPKSTAPTYSTPAPIAAKRASTWGGTETLNIFYCKCGKVYCDECSGGGNAELPELPRLGQLTTSGGKFDPFPRRLAIHPVHREINKNLFRRQPGSARPGPSWLLVHRRNGTHAARNHDFQVGRKIRDEIWYIEQVIDYIGYSLEKPAGRPYRQHSLRHAR